jgi:ubiquinone/menaquinone biosynthesis C-methylase UbiE
MQKPIQETITNYYSQLAPNYDADRFGNSYGQYLHRQETFFMRKMIAACSGPVLSLGCGTGRLMEMATHGADISPAMIDEAVKKFPGKQFANCSAAETVYANGFFKGVFLLHVLMHLPPDTIEAILKEAYRVTAADGWLIVDFPNKGRRKRQSSKEGWHAATGFTTKEFAILANAHGWHTQQHYGLLLFPIHRLPPAVRKLLFWADTWLCSLFTKKYASYTLVKLCKKQQA